MLSITDDILIKIIKQMNYKRSLLYAILNTIILISFIVNNKNLLNRRLYYI